MKEHAFGGKSIASCASGLLLVVLQRLRHVRVDHAPDIAAINAHAKGDRRDDHGKSIGLKGFVDLGAFRGRQSGVIARRFHASIK
jgi:hypothetical protein